MFSTAALAPEDRLGDWRQMLRDVCGSFELEPDDRESFSGTISVTSIGGFDCATISGTAARVLRSSQPASREGAGLYFFVMQLDGSSLMRQDGAEAILKKGHAILIDSGRASEFVYDTYSRHLSLHIPATLLRRHCAPHEPMTVAPFGPDGYCGALSAFVEAIGQTQVPLNSLSIGLARNQILDGVAHIVSGRGNRERAADGEHMNVRLRDAQEHIRKNLSDPALDIATMAKRAGVSVRQLQRLFHSVGTTYGDWVRAERLERCYFDLLNSRPGSDSITRIAFRWGFNDASHFSRAFRTHFGIRARDVRRADKSSLTAQ